MCNVQMQIQLKMLQRLRCERYSGVGALKENGRDSEKDSCIELDTNITMMSLGETRLTTWLFTTSHHPSLYLFL
ncbi:hypothetical protein VNO77_32363 [Canavalia gladiata]|uniref:Uncharacterized protein n=1 Tax=Canavalia gladiata TaxID=3824 RepID=A0AAN9Q518_CANGL